MSELNTQGQHRCYAEVNGMRQAAEQETRCGESDPGSLASSSLPVISTLIKDGLIPWGTDQTICHFGMNIMLTSDNLSNQLGSRSSD